MSEDLYQLFAARLEDFWGRREADPKYARALVVNGCRIEFRANDETLLASAEFAAPQFSSAPILRPEKTFQIYLISQTAFEAPERIPDDLFAHIQYTAHRDWFSLQLGGWGHCFADLGRGFAMAVLAPTLAGEPALVARYLLNTLLTNYLFRNGFAMIHATGLVSGEKLILLLAPHNTGKSTTALQLTLAGNYQLLCDSQVYLARTEQGLQFSGFPVGMSKLRPDMLDKFPELNPFLSAEQVRGERKYTVDLRKLDPGLVCETAVYPNKVAICMLQRTRKRASQLLSAKYAETMDTLMVNSLHFDEPEIWAANIQTIQSLLETAGLYHLSIGADPDAMLRTVNDIFED